MYARVAFVVNIDNLANVNLLDLLFVGVSSCQGLVLIKLYLVKSCYFGH